ARIRRKTLLLSFVCMYLLMAAMTQGDQVFRSVLTRLASQSLMMSFELGHASAQLASPSITPQNHLPKLFISLAVESNWTELLKRLHAAVPATSAINLVCCS